MSYTSVNGTFEYTITNTTNYVFEPADYSIIQSAFDRWDTIMTVDSRFGENYIITVTFAIELLADGILGGASVSTVSYIDTLTYGNTVPYEANLTLNASYLNGMKTDIRSDGKTSYYYVILHEIGHILGIGSFWDLPGTPKVSYLDGGVTKSYYNGVNAFREYSTHFAHIGPFVGIPIEDNGGAGTVNVHPEEGVEGGVSTNSRYINGVFHPGLDTELMTGWLDSSPVSTPLSRITLGFLADMGYGVNYNLADLYTMSWPATTNANNLEQTYIEGFLDVSGGNITNRTGDLNINTGRLFVAGDVSMNTKLSVGGDISMNGNVAIADTKTFTVGTGASTLGGKLSVIGDVSMNGSVDICGNFYAQYPVASIPSSAIIGGVGSNNFDADVSMNAGLSVRNHVTINPITVSETVAGIQNTGEYLKFTIPISTTALKYFCTVHSSMIKDFTIAPYDSSETDKTYYVTTLGFADPYYSFSATSGGAALNNAATPLTLYRGNTYTFIKADTNTSHPFSIGASFNVTTGIKLQGTGSAGSGTSSTYTNPYPLHVNGMVNIENNLNVARTLTVSGTIRQW